MKITLVEDTAGVRKVVGTVLALKNTPLGTSLLAHQRWPEVLAVVNLAGNQDYYGLEDWDGVFTATYCKAYGELIPLGQVLAEEPV